MCNYNCQEDHRYEDHFNALQENQAGVGRHRCAACAFELGVRHAQNGLPKATDDSVLASLPYSQAGTVRHKDAFEAYNDGYDYAIRLAMTIAA